jgi:hypothetical protein
MTGYIISSVFDKLRLTISKLLNKKKVENKNEKISNTRCRNSRHNDAEQAS